MTAVVLDTIWTRPSLMIFSASAPVATNAVTGTYDLGTTYLYLTDDSRSPLQVSIERIETKKRMINGRMRSYHVADKKKFSVSWESLTTNASQISEVRFGGTVNKWAGPQEIVTWHKNNPGSFYLTLVYDTPVADPSVPTKFSLEWYNVFFDDISYTVNKRGPDNDLWDLSMTLVEV